ncbi:MAG: hypothetical protein KAR19_18605 [Bacteroidales bacterium]|nr:hypothetical protein [Bacteroidales bacterium]
MPKYGIHYIALQKTIEKLKASTVAHERIAGDIMESHQGISNLGAIGPDIFFWAPDYPVIDKLFDFYEVYESIVKKYEDITAPIREVKETVGDAAEEVVGSLAPSTVDLIRLAISRIKDTSRDIKRSVAGELFAGLLGINDLFSEIGLIPDLTHELFTSFAPELQKQINSGQAMEASSWYWFDMLHYRRTGNFTQSLLDGATSGKQRAYAYSYLSHVATDTVGHAYVNQIVGGPYRMDVQRHALAENYMDTWAFDDFFNESVSKTLLERLDLPAPSNLPAEIINLLNGSLHGTYANSQPNNLQAPPFLTESEIDTTYSRFYKVMEWMSKFTIERPDPPFDNVLDILSEALDDLLESPPNPPSVPSDLGTCSLGEIFSFGLTSSSRDCYENFFEEAKRYVEYLGELLIWTLETLLDLIDLILATLLALPVTALLALLYGIQLICYQLFKHVNMITSEFGLTYPDRELLQTSVGITSITTILNCGNPFKYPMMKESNRSHLICPLSQAEDPTTAADFHPSSSDVNPRVFITEKPFNLNNLNAYAASPSPMHTREIEKDEKQIGNAVDFTKWLISRATDPNASNAEKDLLKTDWNLDSDRGYGYKNWEGIFDTQRFRFDSEDFRL